MPSAKTIRPDGHCQFAYHRQSSWRGRLQYRARWFTPRQHHFQKFESLGQLGQSAAEMLMQWPHPPAAFPKRYMRRVLDLGVNNYRDRLVKIGVGMNIQMADAIGMAQNRNPGGCHNGLYQLIGPAWDHQINILRIIQHRLNCFAAIQQLCPGLGQEIQLGVELFNQGHKGMIGFLGPHDRLLKTATLPLFKIRDKICGITSGRASNITPMTPMGTDFLVRISPSSS